MDFFQFNSSVFRTWGSSCSFSRPRRINENFCREEQEICGVPKRSETRRAGYLAAGFEFTDISEHARYDPVLFASTAAMTTQQHGVNDNDENDDEGDNNEEEEEEEKEEEEDDDEEDEHVYRWRGNVMLACKRIRSLPSGKRKCRQIGFETFTMMHALTSDLAINGQQNPRNCLLISELNTYRLLAKMRGRQLRKHRDTPGIAT